MGRDKPPANSRSTNESKISLRRACLCAARRQVGLHEVVRFSRGAKTLPVNASSYSWPQSGHRRRARASHAPTLAGRDRRGDADARCVRRALGQLGDVLATASKSRIDISISAGWRIIDPGQFRRRRRNPGRASRQQFRKPQRGQTLMAVVDSYCRGSRPTLQRRS